MRSEEILNPERSCSELAIVGGRVRKGISGVEHLASVRVDEIYQPLPDGFNYFPSSFFLLACRSLDLMTKGIVSFACAVEALSLAFKALLSLIDLKELGPPPEQDEQHSEGMTLLLADGLILLSYKFLTELDSKELRSISPLLAHRAREWTRKIDSCEDREKGLVNIQRSLSAMALQALKVLDVKAGNSMKVIDELAVQTDRLLTKYRNSENGDERRSVVKEFEELSRSLSENGKWSIPLCSYVSLVISHLIPTS